MKIHEYNQMMAYLTRPNRTGYYKAGYVTPVTSEQKAKALERFNTPFEDLSPLNQSRIRTNYYDQFGPIGQPRAPVTKKQEKIAQYLYKKSFKDLTKDQRTRIRSEKTTMDSGKDIKNLMSNVERAEYSNERLKNFVDSFKKENNRLPSITEIRKQGKFDFIKIKQAEAEGIIEVGKLGESRGVTQPRFKEVNKDILKLSKNKKILDTIKKGGLPNLSDISKILNVDKNIAAGRVYQLASALAGDREIEGFNIRDKKGANKILNNPQGYNYQLRRLAEAKIKKETGENI